MNPLSPRRALIVSADSSLRAAVARTLEHWSLQVLAVAPLEVHVLQAVAFAPQIVFVDSGERIKELSGFLKAVRKEIEADYFVEFCADLTGERLAELPVASVRLLKPISSSLLETVFRNFALPLRKLERFEKKLAKESAELERPDKLRSAPLTLYCLAGALLVFGIILTLYVIDL